MEQMSLDPPRFESLADFALAGVVIQIPGLVVLVEEGVVNQLTITSGPGKHVIS